MKKVNNLKTETYKGISINCIKNENGEVICFENNIPQTSKYVGQGMWKSSALDDIKDQIDSDLNKHILSKKNVKRIEFSFTTLEIQNKSNIVAVRIRPSNWGEIPNSIGTVVKTKDKKESQEIKSIIESSDLTNFIPVSFKVGNDNLVVKFDISRFNKGNSDELFDGTNSIHFDKKNNAIELLKNKRYSNDSGKDNKAGPLQNNLLAKNKILNKIKSTSNPYVISDLLFNIGRWNDRNSNGSLELDLDSLIKVIDSKSNEIKFNILYQVHDKVFEWSLKNAIDSIKISSPYFMLGKRTINNKSKILIIKSKLKKSDFISIAKTLNINL